MSRPEELRAALARQARTEGFDALGVTHPDAAPQAGERLKAWLAQGCHGEMLWMETTAERRADPATLWPPVRSVIMLGTSYAPALDPWRWHDAPERGVISVYALGRDYHDVIKPRLKRLARWLLAQAPPGHDARVFVDTAPVMEKPLAEAAGIGWQGKHSNLVSRTHGSWLFLAAIFTTLELRADAPHADRCGRCRACQEVCPTGAFPAPYRLDARRCISYLTIEHRGPIPEDLRPGIGNRVYGCDDCLAVCPWNKFARAAHALAFQPRPGMDGPPLAELLALDDPAFRARFAGSPVKRIGRGRMVRNAAIAAGNSGRPELVPALRPLVGDADPVVAEAARWALAQLSRPGG